RTCDIRRLIGPYPLGSSDPAQLTGETREAFRGNPKVSYGVPTYAEAVPRLLDERRYSSAMWAARLSTAFEDPARGGEWTDEVRADPDVEAARRAVRRQPAAWKDVMLSPAEREPPPGHEGRGA